MIGPNLILAAAPRSGSTQLTRWLESHAQIGLSPIKEPNHFSAHEFDPDDVARTHLDDCDPDCLPLRAVQFAVVRRRQSYSALFAGLQQKWRMEASTSYLSCPEAPASIRAALPEARIILLTRDPVARAVSHYGLACRTGRTRSSLGQELAAELDGRTVLSARFLVRPSRQKAGVARFRSAFPPDRVLHLQFEQMIADPITSLLGIAEFLDIDPTGFSLAADARNATAMPRFPGLNALLLRSGLKTALRRSLPQNLKPALKRLWFDARARPRISEDDRLALARALADET